jgi:hypothetical protein
MTPENIPESRPISKAKRSARWLKSRSGAIIRAVLRHTPLRARFRPVKYGVEIRPWYRWMLTFFR